jgi:hypothetical protein
MFRPRGTDFKSISDFNSEWSDRIANLILLGLVVDIVNLFFSEGSVWRIPVGIIADVLIIAGVWGELWFLKRARSADDGRVAEAEKALADATIRAAALEKEAAEARERVADIEKLTSPRHISPRQQSAIVQKINGKIPRIAFLNFEDNSSEAIGYAKDFEKLLIFAGANNLQMRPNHVLIGNEPFFGVSCFSTPDPIYGRLFIEACEEAGIKVLPGNVAPAAIHPVPQNPTLWVLVGFKPQ